MQYRVYNRKTLKYVDGGYVVSYNIDDDYIVNNNSTISVVKKLAQYDSTVKSYVANVGETYDSFYDGYFVDKTYTLTFEDRENPIIRNVLILSGENGERGKVLNFHNNQFTIRFLSDIPYSLVSLKVQIQYEGEDNNSLSNVLVGDIIALIQDSGAFHKGVITAVDTTALTISYKSDKELFNDNIINLLAGEFVGEGNEEITVARKFGVESVIQILQSFFSDESKLADPLQALPLIFEADGDVTDKNTGEPKMLWTWADDSINIVDWLTELFEKYNLTMSFSIDFNTAEEILAKRKPKYIVTFSAITNSGNIIKDNVDMQTITYTTQEIPQATVCKVIDSESKDLLATYYLVDNGGTYDITDKQNNKNRVLPVKTTVASLNTKSESNGNTTEEDVAKEKLIPSQFNQAIEIRINSTSKMFDFANARFGDLYKIINARGTIDSVFTGKKISSEERWTTLYFGLGRQNYTDIMQMRLRKQRYTEVYNK